MIWGVACGFLVHERGWLCCYFFVFSDLVSLFSYVHSVAGFFFLSFFFSLFILFRGQFGFRVLVSHIGVS